ncbi:MAG: PD-(D/E)XK nuclease family protein [Eubacteriales bacterium]
MKVEIVYGQSTAKNSDYLYSRAWQRAELGKKTIILVPEQYTLEAEKRLMNAKSDTKGMIEIQVMSIKRLMNWIFSSVKKPKEQILDETGKTLIIKSILRKHSTELLIFERAAAMPGFSSSVSDFISDLKKFNVTGDDLIGAAGDADKESPVYKKAEDIKKILEYYDEANRKIKSVDSDDSIDILCGIIDEASPELKKFFKDTSVFFDSFDYIPAKNIQLMFSILPNAEHVMVTAAADENKSGELYAAGADTIASIEKMADAVGAQIQYKYIDDDSDEKDGGIIHLKKHLYSYPYVHYEGETNIQVTKALGKNEEVEYAAASILKLAAEQKYKWSEISVLCSSMDKYSSYISRIFKQYEIPYFLDERRTVTSHPVVVWLLSAMQFAGTHLREYLLDMIKTLYTPLSQKDIEEFEDYCIACSIQGDMFFRDFRRGAQKHNLKILNERRKEIISQIKEFDTSEKSAAQWAKGIYALLESAQIPVSINRERSRLEEMGRLDEAAETVQSWNVIIKILEQLYAISSDDSLDLDDIISLLEECFSNVQIGVLPTGINKVTVGDVGRSKTADIKCTFILGANEGLLPISVPEGTIFADNELEVFAQNGVSAGRGGEFRKSESNYNLYSAIISPKDMLHISYDCSGGGEKALIVEKILTLIPDLIVEAAHIDPMICPASAFSAAAKALGAIGDSRPYKDGTWKAGLSALMEDEKYADNIEKMYNFAAGGSTQHEIMQSIDGDLVASVSQLEKYAKCPFAYMITYGLQPEDNPQAQIQHVSSGAYLHKVMEEFGRELMDKDIQKLSDNEIGIMMQKKAKHIAAVFEDGVFSIDAKNEFLSEQLMDTALRSSMVYAKGLRNSSFLPIAHEMTFDIGKEFGPIKIDLPNGKKVLLRGKIDRVDEYSSGSEKWLRAVDYKSGRKSVDLTGLMTGEDLQLFVYANALQENTGDNMAGVFYFPLRNDYTDEAKDQSDVERMNGLFVDNSNVLNALDTSIDAGEKSQIVNLKYKNDKTPWKNEAIKTPTYFDAAMKAAMNTAKNLCTKMDKGEMEVNPIADKTTSACAYCEYQNICRFGAQTYSQNQKPNADKVDEYIKGFEGGDSNEVD